MPKFKKKSELLPLYLCHEESIESILVKSEVKYLGLTISKDSNIRELVNIEERIDSIKKNLLILSYERSVCYGQNPFDQSRKHN